ncbi:hypothetical protein PAPYR_12206 [Paratrimastix pyriformis]|uniref:Uncharacterized protein n=1 Tax=Paratrimastix pyriformis TaxID=342808 RepID=A0ABQ8U6W7_9EUKA|nr:hypothetical protein PAPYR_12206 [Paratrimastix pyriformis]
MMTGPPCFFTVPFLDSPEDCERYARVGLRYTPHMRLLLYPPGLPPAPAHQAPLSTAARLSMPSVGPITMSAVPHGLPLRGATWAEHLQPLRVTLDRLRDMYAKAGCLGPAALKAPGHAAGPSPLGAVWSVAVDGMWSPDVALQYLPVGTPSLTITTLTPDVSMPSPVFRAYGGLIQYIEQPWPPQFFLELHIRFVATESAAQPSTVARLRPRPRLRPHLGGHPGHPGSSTAGHPATPMRGILQRPAILMMGARTPGGSAAAAAAAGSTPAERFSDRSGFAFGTGGRYGAATLHTDLPGLGIQPRVPLPSLASSLYPPVSITLPALPTITAPATPTLTSPPNVESTPAQAAVTTTPVRGPPAQPPFRSPGAGRGCYPATAKPTPAPGKPPGTPAATPETAARPRVSYSELRPPAGRPRSRHPPAGHADHPKRRGSHPGLHRPAPTTPAAAYPSSITTPA